MNGLVPHPSVLERLRGLIQSLEWIGQDFVVEVILEEPASIVTAATGVI